ncbi:MAG TPA: ABC transporter substrate binding protein, partial [Halanaerobiales bacterium]|nr:ABC transporter substrate binding protein [Halanaerobiales bacterium]
RLGRQTGEMALRILRGESGPEDMSIESQKDYRLVLNIDAAKAMGVVIPEELLNNADEIYTNN